MKNSIKNFKSKLSLLCGNDKLRPALSYIYFKEGYAYCTDARVALKQALSISQFTKAEIEFMNGQCIHHITFNEIWKTNIVNVTVNGFECVLKNDTKVNFPFAKFGYAIPNIDAIIKRNKDQKGSSISFIAFNLKFLNKFTQGMYFDGDFVVEMNFKGINKSALVTVNGIDEQDQIGLIMPVHSNTN